MKIKIAILLAALVILSGCTQQQKLVQTPTPTSISSPTQIPLSPTVAEKHFTIKQQTPPIALTSDIESKVGEIADCYYRKTQKSLTVTSGTRGSSAQAQAMFDKLKLGDNLNIYKNKIARDEIVKAYTNGLAAGEKDEEIVDDMAGVIDDQISSGVYISRHLISGAVDFSQSGMTATDKTAFETCAKSTKGVSNVIDESNPVHFHIEVEKSASFATLTTSMAGNGYGEIVPSQNKCESECTVTSGTKITLTAKADDDSEFEGWSGDCSGTGSCVLIMDKDKSVTARFKLKELETPTPTAEPTISITPTPTPTPTPTQAPEEKSSGSIDSASCVNERNQYGYIQSTKLTVGGKASGPVGTVLYSSLDPTCSSWSKGMGVTCVRKAGEPEQTSWTGSGNWPPSETRYAVSITGVDPNPSISFTCQG